MRGLLKEHRQSCIEFGVLLGVLLLRMFWFEFEYYPQLDDYIQHRPYPAGTDFLAICMQRGLFASRPLAGILDFVLWGRMPFALAAVVLTAMYALSAVLYKGLFRTYFGTGLTFLVVYALLPGLMEGNYWLAASTRIVPPLLFSALALICFDRFCGGGGFGWLAGFLLWTALSFCFYEQVLVLSLALSLMVMLLQLLKRNRRALWGLTVFLPLALYALVTGYFSSLNTGELSSRMELMLPWQPGYFTRFLPSLGYQLIQSFLTSNVVITAKGFLRGIPLLLKNPVGLLFLAALLAGFYAVGRGERKQGTLPLGWLFGLLAALAPISPFFLLANPWFSLRGIVPSFVGLALVADLLVGGWKHGKKFAVLLAAVCMVASISEVHDYREASRHNDRVAEVILAADGDWTGTVGIVALDQNYLEDQNFFYHDHILGTHASDWALTGLLQYYDGGKTLSYKPTPLATDEAYFWQSWNRSLRDVTAYDSLYGYDHTEGTLVPLTVQEREGEWYLHQQDGALWARIWTDAQGRGHIAIS